MGEDVEQDVGTPIWPAMGAVAFVFFLWGMNLYVLHDAKDRGTFGDMFGAVNAIFSGLAFAGVSYAIYIQRQEIKLARTEIRQTKKILERQQEQLSLQNEETRKQIFESTFFQLLRLLTDLTAAIDLVRDGRTTKGKDVFPVFLGRLRKEYMSDGSVLYDKREFQGVYERFYQKHNSELGHYFRTVYNIVKFVDASDVKNKKFYTNILRAQLSDAEVALLFHNGLSPYGREKFKPLMERYGLLKNATDRDLLDIKLREGFKASAFA
ncbi:putative phage abortive infection protein [Ferrovibrio sp.]|uniref:putative phage abortive infection protein n=1 Tax=Ferrovibrio sp. TaxID=1917215 RepID=UPI0035115C5B